MADSTRARGTASERSTGVLDYLASAGIAAEGLAVALAFVGLGAIAAGHSLGRALVTAGLGVLGMVLASGAGLRDSNLLDRGAGTGEE